MNEVVQNVMQSYFHQDWRDEFSSIDDVVRSIVNENPADFVASLIEQLDRMLEDNKTDMEIYSVLEALSAEYAPVNVRDWLATLLILLRAESGN